MTALTKPRMTVDEYLAWAVGRPGRYELFQGEVFAMSPETVGHATAKAAVYSALAAGIRQNRLPCHVLPDGVTIRIDETTAYEPDVQVYCGDKLPPPLRSKSPIRSSLSKSYRRLRAGSTLL
jgi:Uma2 family endonuclease